MALFKFTKSILENKKINLYNHGNHFRDFTYIDDVVESIFRIIFLKPKSKIPFEVYNVGSSNPISLKKYLSILEKKLNKKAIINKLGLQEGDIIKTYSDNTKLWKKISFKPSTKIEYGVQMFIDWYKSYYNIT